MARVGYAGLLLLLLMPSGGAMGATYHVSSVDGNDGNDGLSPASAWATLTQVNAATFQPGDSILFRADGEWSGQLHPQGAGADGSPIVIDMYGFGNKPAIHGEGNVTDTVVLQNQEYWEIRNLEITNFQEGDSSLKRGVYVEASDVGTLHHIHLINLDIHDVNGDLSTKDNGGIFIRVSGSSIPTRFDDLLIEGCTVRDVDRTGISNQSSWDGRDGCEPEDVIDWFPSLNVVIRNNIIERAGQNGMIVRVAESALIEYNTFIDNGAKGSGNAFFCFNTNDTTVQYNEAYGTVYNSGEADAGGFDGDYRCCGTLFQYNYSHDNGKAGFVVVCNGSTRFNDGTVIRYNILQNNEREAFRLSGACTTNTRIYNNVVFVDSSQSSIDIVLHKSWGGYADNTHYYNNIFYDLGTDSSYDLGSSTNNVFDYNVFFGNHPVSEPYDPNKLTSDPKLVSPGSGGIGMSTVDGYTLQQTSPCIESGVAVVGDGGLDYWGNSVPIGEDTDRGANESQCPPVAIPAMPVFISGVSLTDGNDYPILTFQDPNQPSQVTGYNVYRASDAGLPPASWPPLASDVVDMDAGTPNSQWADSSGDVSPSGVWYYQVTAFNSICAAEGPR